MAVSRKLCGAVIGQKGATIREFMADSGATIRVQPLAELTPSDSERLISVSGSRDRVLRAVALILNTVSSSLLSLHPPHLLTSTLQPTYTYMLT
jgi:RNA-binding protein Nova